MSIIFFQILELIVMVAVLVCLTVTKKIKDNDMAMEKFYNIQQWADIVVRWASDRLKGEPGHNKRQAAIGALKEINDKLGFGLTDGQISMLISSAYQVIYDYEFGNHKEVAEIKEAAE